MSEAGKVLLIAKDFRPIRGGSAVVYDNLARFSGGQLIPIAPQRSYLDGSPLIGWQEHDSKASYRVLRLPLLRNVLWPGGKVPPLRRAALLFADLTIRARLAVLLRQSPAGASAAVCVGELVASAWVLGVLRLAALDCAARSTCTARRSPRGTTTTPGWNAAAAPCWRRTTSSWSAASPRAWSRAAGAAGQGRIRLIENGVDMSASARWRPADLAGAVRLDGGFVFVSVCRLLEKKGIDQAIRAFATVAAAFPDSRYLMVGDGPYRARWRRSRPRAGWRTRCVRRRGGRGRAGRSLLPRRRVRHAQPPAAERRHRGVRPGVPGGESPAACR